MYNIFRELNCNQTITVYWDEQLENLVSYSTYTAKETPFHSEIKMLVILRMLFAYCTSRLNQLGHMDALKSVYCFLLFSTVYCEFYPMFSTVFTWLTSYGFARS